MNYLSQLVENEVYYICSLIPLRDLIYYFKKNPKDFSKIMPGFRATSIKNQVQASALLFKYRNRYFISSFIEKNINNWLNKIQENIVKMMENGDSKESALLQTLQFSFFADNVGLYFKLIHDKYSEEYIALFSAAIIAIKEAFIQQKKSQDELKVKESEIKKLQTRLSFVELNLQQTEIKLNEYKTEIQALNYNLTELNKLIIDAQNDKEMIVTLEDKVQIREETINDLRNTLTEVKNNSQQLENQIRNELEKQQATKVKAQQVTLKPKCPHDIEEFKDNLGYNLENIGVPAGSAYYTLLKTHLSKILFQGIPVVISMGVGKALMKCVANALIGQSNIKTITFSKDLSIDDIDCFLLSAGRIICFDNFIGNYNETELLPLFNKHMSKIIFLTVAYDRTINYISGEFLRYCQYLNLNHITALFANVELKEETSTIEEIEFEPPKISCDNRYSSLLREMLGEFGFLQNLAEKKCAEISDEQDLCRMLAFDILPYCVDVLQIAPYNISERLVKYAGDTGRCSYKNLFKGWFGQ